MVRFTQIEREFIAISEECENAKCNSKIKNTMQCECGRLLLRQWLERQITEHFNGYKMYFWTVYLDRDVFIRGRLSCFKMTNSKRSINRYIKKLELMGFRAIGFLDIQLQEFKDYPDLKIPEWLCHYHFLVISKDNIGSIRLKLRSAFPKRSKYARPSNIKVATKLPFNYSYLIKFDYEMKRKLKTHKKGQSQEHSRIKGVARQELQDYLGSIHLLKTIYLIGMRRHYDSIHFI